MKYCNNCRNYFPDNAYYCSVCGNRNLIYLQNQVQPQKQSNFKFGKFFVDYFKSPNRAKQEMIERKDFGSALLMNGITLLLYYIIILCVEGGIGTVQPMTSIFLPIIIFINFFGFQFLDIFLYSLYSRSKKTNKKENVAFSSYIYASTTNKIPFFFTAIIACFFALILKGTGAFLLIFVVLIDIMGTIDAKIKCGFSPVSFLDSFMFLLTCMGALLFGLGLTSLFGGLIVGSDLSSRISNLFSFF